MLWLEGALVNIILESGIRDKRSFGNILISESQTRKASLLKKLEFHITQSPCPALPRLATSFSMTGDIGDNGSSKNAWLINFGIPGRAESLAGRRT